MTGPQLKRILIVAHRTAATPTLIDHIRGRGAAERCRFTLLVPELPAGGPEEAEETLELALPLLEEATGEPVEGLVGPSDALLAVERLLVSRTFDEVIVSTMPERVSHW